MKKSLRKVLAVVLCLSVLLTFAPMAMAKSTTDDNGYSFKGVYRVKQGNTLTVTAPSEVLAADDYEVYIENDDVAIISGVSDTGTVTINTSRDSWGATVLTFETYDSDGWWEESYNFVVVVYDEEDEGLTGKVTDVYAYSEDVRCGDYSSLEYEVETDGEVYWSTIVYYDGYGIYLEDNGYFEAYDRGEIEGILYVIDTNGNIVSDTFTITSRYTPLQMIRNFFRTIISFLFGWIFGY